MKKITEERFGLVMIIATLTVILLITGQYLVYHQKTRESVVRTEGRNVVHLLTKLSYDQLVPSQKQNSILDLLNVRQIDSDFAYAAVVDRSGQPLVVSSSGAALIPPANLQNDTTLWATELEFQSQENQRTILEFRAPIMTQGELAGYIRVGYFTPGYAFQELPFIAQLALPIFLLVPLTYMLICLELKPLKEASNEINQALHRQHISTATDSTANFQDFMQNFKLFLHEIDRRFGELHSQNFKTTATNLALNYNRQRIESALQSLPDAVLVMDETGKATYANAKLNTIIGQSATTIIGTTPDEWCKDKQVSQLLAKYYNHQSRLHRSDSVEINLRHHPEKTIAVSAYPLFTPKDTETMLGTLVVFHDKTQEILAKSARDQFVGSISHELKSPLNVIHMSAETLLDNDISDAERIESINIINDEVERLSLLITNLLNITMMEAGTMVLACQRVKVADFLRDIMTSVARGSIADDIQFNAQLSNNLSTTEVDKNLLRIALNNLFTNAVKYNKRKGKVTLFADETDDQLIIKISDTGIGIAEQDQKLIFEKFYRSQNDAVRKKSGHGLGLTLAKEIIELHGGKLSLQSTVGEGSTFTIVLKKTSSLLKAS